VEDQQEGGRAHDGGQPGVEVEEPVQGVDVEQLLPFIGYCAEATPA
jgi:hypothetical protein